MEENEGKSTSRSLYILVATQATTLLCPSPSRQPSRQPYVQPCWQTQTCCNIEFVAMLVATLVDLSLCGENCGIQTQRPRKVTKVAAARPLHRLPANVRVSLRISQTSDGCSKVDIILRGPTSRGMHTPLPLQGHPSTHRRTHAYPSSSDAKVLHFHR